MKFYSIFFLFWITSAVLYDTDKYDLGNNLIVNPGFDHPEVPPHKKNLHRSTIYGWETYSKFQVVNVMRMCEWKLVTCSVSFVQGIDINSSLY